MTILKIAWKEIKQDFRDIRTLVFMLAFPVILMLVLGTALTGAFNEEISIDDMEVLYTNTNTDLDESFKEFTKEAADSGIHFKEIQDGEKGKELVEHGESAGYLSVDQSGFHLFVNDQNSVEASILQGTLAAFLDRYNLVVEIMKAAPEKAESILKMDMQRDYIKDHSLLPEKQPGSMDYYAIVMTTMIVLYAAMGASHLMIGERVRNTAVRLMVAPIRKWEIFIGKLSGSIVINMICIMLVVLFSEFVFHANWGERLDLVFLLLLTEVIFAISFGLGISFLIKSTAGPTMVIMIVVQLASFFGGAYFPIENADGLTKIVTNLSPLTLQNDALFHMIYANDLSYMLPAIAMNIGLACLFLLIATVALKRREGL